MVLRGCSRISRPQLLAAFTVALAWAQFRESGASELAARLELAIEPRMPARVYLFKDGRPFRLSPVQALLPLRVDSFYRERIWRAGSGPPETLEVTCSDQSHSFLLRGGASFDLPAGRYRVEAYRGLFYTPAVAEFELKAGEPRRVALALKDWTGGAGKQWISADDHIHLTRSREDDEVFLSWLEAEDLSVGNFLQLQRQMDASVQYAFGPRGEARRGAYAIRPGHESRSEFFGHVNLLGGREMIRPLSVGAMYGNAPLTYPYPAVLFGRGREVGATVGYAHFQGSMPHSTLLMDLALGNIDFVEILQFGVLKTEAWYELLNAGFRVAGIAGSDFPVQLNRQKAWPRYIPLLGPERTLVKARSGASPYEAWAEGVRRGEAVVTNGPLVDLEVRGGIATASARFFRPLLKLEIVVNGQAAASAEGGKELRAEARLPPGESLWVAARAAAVKEEGEPDIQAHTNPLYVLRENQPVMVRSARQALARRWEAELAYYRTAPLVFPSDSERRQFFARAEQAL
ncbi:MAG: CehA/McbA family metallohydrolase, partial [Acidobacteria bacterium]|nr:CehA/McbA family metallohydrolase [Acidobacteriota bacterium]